MSVNLQHIRNLVSDKLFWAFSIAFDGASNRGDNYIDVRIILTVKGKIVNLHGLAITIHGSHTGEHIHFTVKEFLQGLLGDMWKDKMISSATDGARNMTGKVAGAVTRFEREGYPGFFRI